VLQTRLEDAVESRKACEERASKLSEDLASTTQTYDSQLAVMTEHLANMNEKLALQKDTIDHLKFQSKVCLEIKISYLAFIAKLCIIFAVLTHRHQRRESKNRQ